jgi:hypothetical protein
MQLTQDCTLELNELGTCSFNNDYNRGRTKILPENLRQWLGETELAYLVVDSVQRHRQNEPHLTRTGEILLALITYSYATGLYCSDDIELWLSENRTLPDTCAIAFGCAGPAQTIRRFRRHERTRIQDCLSEVCRRAYHLLQGADVSTERAITPCEEPNFLTESMERIDRAIKLDCWAMDI